VAVRDNANCQWLFGGCDRETTHHKFPEKNVNMKFMTGACRRNKGDLNSALK
jgi:hypothetical protein